VVGIIFAGNKSTTVLLTLAPTESHTMAPTSARSNRFRSVFSELLGSTKEVYEIGTPQYSAAEWIMNEDPLKLEADDTGLFQRYMMAFLYFHTTKNGKEKWRSCNPPQEGEDDTCTFLQFDRASNDTEIYVPKEGKIRWLSGQGVCSWEGVLCAGGASVLGVFLCK
jgi:hypothetical protein